MRKKVLVVDEDENTLKAFERFFKKEHILMKEATNLQNARSLLTSENFHLLILNVGIDAAVGIELLEFKKGFQPRLPVVIITAFPEMLRKWDFKGLGITHFFSKPFDINELRRVVENELRNHPNHPMNQN